MKPHRFAEIWPVLKGKALDDLALDIAAHGLRLPILTYQGKILDGRSREAACAQAGVEPRYEDADASDEADALGLVISLNVHRRQLALEERAFAAARLANIVHGHNRFLEKIIDSSVELSTISEAQRAAISLAQAAKVMTVSLASAKRAKAVLEYAKEEGAQEVTSGKKSLATKCAEVRPKRELKAEKPAKRAKPGRPRKDERRNVLPRAHTVMALTREQVDPEFVGDGGAFKDKYGHVVMHTAEERARIRFADWASGMRLLAKTASQYPNWSEVDANWLRSPKSSDIGKLTEALEILRPRIAEAERLLALAVAVTKEKEKTTSDRGANANLEVASKLKTTSLKPEPRNGRAC